MSVTIVTAHGLGDAILGLSAAKCVSKVNPDVRVLVSTRKEVFDPLFYAFRPFLKFPIEHIPEELMSDCQLIKDINLLAPYASLKDEIAIVWPDALFRNPYALDWQKYHIHPQVIKTMRLLKRKWHPQKRIYAGLVSSTDGYVYKDIPKLLNAIAEVLPEYEVHFPFLETWASKKLSLGDFSQPFRNNVIIHHNPEFKEQIDLLSTCCYSVVADNGISHIAYHLGQPRLLLDSRLDQHGLPWTARWKEDISESISIQTPATLVAMIVETNIAVPQTCLIPREAVMANLLTDWAKKLFFKY